VNTFHYNRARMTASRLISLVCLLHFSSAVAQAWDDSFAVFSPSRMLIADFHRNSERFDFKLFQLGKNLPEPLWTGSIAVGSNSIPPKVLISEESRAVVIRAEAPGGHDEKALWIFSNGKLVRSLSLEEVMNRASIKPTQDHGTWGER
jgi:hypothetical protein